MADSLLKASILTAAAQPAAPSVTATALEDEVVGLFDELRSPVLRYLFGLGLPIQDGEEIVQEVFLALFQHLRDGKSRSNLRGWIFRVAHNLGLNRRDASRRTGAVEGIAQAAADPAPDPEVRVVNAQRQNRMLAVLNALPEQDRLCLYLRAEGLRYREMAKVLDMSLGAISISLTRSLARMARVAER